MSNSFLVSVIMITYGHEKFIRQAIEGVLMQECNFDVELIIANDCSPDNTDFVINEIIKTHKRASWINYIKHEKNIGMMPNFIYTLQKAQGKYIALCEGDDYWTDPYKLQKQVDFLEANPNFNICFTRANTLKGDKLELFQLPYNAKDNIFKYEDLIQYNDFIATASVMFRKTFSEIPNWFYKFPVGDMPLYLLLTQKNNKIKCLQDITTVYRIHETGVWSGIKLYERKEKLLNVYRMLYPHLNTTQKKITTKKYHEVTQQVGYIKYKNNRLMNLLYRIKLKIKFELCKL